MAGVSIIVGQPAAATTLLEWNAYETQRWVEAHIERGLDLNKLDRDLRMACYALLNRMRPSSA